VLQCADVFDYRRCILGRYVGNRRHVPERPVMRFHALAYRATKRTVAMVTARIQIIYEWRSLLRARCIFPVACCTECMSEAMIVSLPGNA